jgi:hypothetical protein
MRASFVAMHESPIGTSRTSGDVRLESAKWTKADIDQVVVANRDFITARPLVPPPALGERRHRRLARFGISALPQ